MNSPGVHADIPTKYLQRVPPAIPSEISPRNPFEIFLQSFIQKKYTRYSSGIVFHSFLHKQFQKVSKNSRIPLQFPPRKSSSGVFQKISPVIRATVPTEMFSAIAKEILAKENIAAIPPQFLSNRVFFVL